MASPAQINANTLNAQLSTGPRTESGKAATKLNAFKHGLTAGTVVLPTEDMEAYQQFSAAICASFEPVGPLEDQIAQLIADTHWRLNRIPTLETNIFALAQFEPVPEHLAHLEDGPARTALIQANAFIAYERQFRNLHLQEQRLHRILRQAMSDLSAIQTNRLPEEPANAIGFDFRSKPQPMQPHGKSTPAASHPTHPIHPGKGFKPDIPQ
jgi:hypothetical protein